MLLKMVLSNVWEAKASNAQLIGVALHSPLLTVTPVQLLSNSSSPTAE